MGGSELQPGTLPSEQVPTPQIVAQSAPGKRGPTGLSPRTNYSRANTSPAPAGDGAAEFKALEPPKLAGVIMRSFNQGFSVHQLLEQVTLDSLSSVKLAEEARNQDKPDKKKTEDKKKPDDCDMEHAGKTAAALIELADMFDKIGESSSSNENGGTGSVRTEPTMTGKPLPASHPSSQGSAAHQAPHSTPNERAHPSESATATATVDVTQAMAGPGPKMAGFYTQSPLFLAKEADLSDARKAELKSMGHDKAKSTKDIFDKLRGGRELAKVPHSDASVVMKNGRNAGEALARTATGGSGASITKNMGHLATAPKGKKGLLAAGAALAAGGAAAVGKHMHDKAKLDKLRKGIAAGAAGAAAAGGAAAAVHHARKEAAETSPKVVDVLASTPPPGGPSGLLASNESATNFSRGDAYKNRVVELNKMLDERVGGAGDTTLRQVLSTTGEADPKMAAAQKTAAQVLFTKMQANGAGTLLGLLGGIQ